jgi:hypothetical protein
MKLKFNHSHSIFSSDGNPLIYLEAYKENESERYMFENGWIPYYDRWYQTRSARLKTQSISDKRRTVLKSINISDVCTNKEILIPNDIDAYSSSEFIDFFFDDVFWGRVNIYGDQILYSVMNNVKSKKSYGTISFYYLIDRFKNDYEHLYISDFFPQFEYKKSLSGFEYWDGNAWTNKLTTE